jgi:hypothetical protein
LRSQRQALRPANARGPRRSPVVARAPAEPRPAPAAGLHGAPRGPPRQPASRRYDCTVVRRYGCAAARRHGRPAPRTGLRRAPPHVRSPNHRGGREAGGEVLGRPAGAGRSAVRCLSRLQGAGFLSGSSFMQAWRRLALVQHKGLETPTYCQILVPAGVRARVGRSAPSHYYYPPSVGSESDTRTSAYGHTKRKSTYIHCLQTSQHHTHTIQHNQPYIHTKNIQPLTPTFRPTNNNIQHTQNTS